MLVIKFNKINQNTKIQIKANGKMHLLIMLLGLSRAVREIVFIRDISEVIKNYKLKRKK